MPRSNGRVAAPRLTDAQAQVAYDQHVEAGNNAAYDHVAEREFARADSIAERHPVSR